MAGIPWPCFFTRHYKSILIHVVLLYAQLPSRSQHELAAPRQSSETLPFADFVPGGSVRDLLVHPHGLVAVHPEGNPPDGILPLASGNPHRTHMALHFET